MDSVGEARTKTDVCLPVLSPDALESRYAFELAGIQYLDFTNDSARPFDTLFGTLVGRLA
ncbi:MAG: hypothetical protein PVI57_02700 [Gemmatimonadota bacterium]|jgi:hypothetical protein